MLTIDPLNEMVTLEVKDQLYWFFIVREVSYDSSKFENDKNWTNNSSSFGWPTKLDRLPNSTLSKMV